MPQADHSLQARFRPFPHVISTMHADATVLLDVERGMYYTLNEVGGRIWALLADSGSVGGIVSRLREEYDVAPERLEGDVAGLVERLRAARLVERVSA